MKRISTQVCIVGAGPGGAVLGLLLAKEGINVVVIEKSKDYAREFRGEFIAPDSVNILTKLKIMDQLGADQYLKNEGMELYDDGQRIACLDFTAGNKLQPIDIPQPTLLRALVTESKKFGNYQYINGATAKNLLLSNASVNGVICHTPQGEITVQAKLVVGADGRYGKIRKLANLEVSKKNIKRDFVWFNLPRPPQWPATIKLKLYKNYQLMILPTYPDLLRVGFNIPSGEYGKLTKKPISALHHLVSLLEPNLQTIVESFISSWSQTSLLDIFTATLPSWSCDGLVVIGDAAHTLTPVLGQGVNHAISDAEALAPIIVRSLKAKPDQIIPQKTLKEFEKMRKPDVNFVSKFQLRQEKMLQLNGAVSVMLRKCFYKLLGNNVIKTVLMRKIFYKYSYRK